MIFYAQVSSFGKKANYSIILESIIKCANKNMGKPPEAQRYDDTLKYFCTYIYMVGGKFCYEILSKNLHFPAVSTISNIIL